MSRRTWTEEDEHLLRQVVYSGGADAAYKAFPDRGRKAVHSKMQRMGLLSPKVDGWTDSEDSVLFNDYTELGAAGIASSGRLPGRTCASIQHRARFLGLRFGGFAPAGASPSPERRRRWSARDNRFAYEVARRMREAPMRKYLIRAANLLDVSERELAAYMLEFR